MLVRVENNSSYVMFSLYKFDKYIILNICEWKKDNLVVSKHGTLL
jgi:hypothetical protein